MSFIFRDAAQMKTGSRSGSLESLGEQLDSAQSAESLETSDNHLNHLNHHHLSNLGMLLGNIPNVVSGNNGNSAGNSGSSSSSCANSTDEDAHSQTSISPVLDNLLNVNSQADQLFATSQTQQNDAKGIYCKELIVQLFKGDY